MLKNIKTNKGFTIIEVLIVLAIAGLIMLIVFLAVPALQRNSRNTSRRSDVSRILGAVQEVINNNGNSMASVNNTNIVNAVGTLSYYTTSATNPSVGSKAYTNNAANVTPDTLVVRTSAKCDSNGNAVDGSARQIAVLYRVEPDTAQCTSN